MSLHSHFSSAHTHTPLPTPNQPAPLFLSQSASHSIHHHHNNNNNKNHQNTQQTHPPTSLSLSQKDQNPTNLSRKKEVRERGSRWVYLQAHPENTKEDKQNKKQKREGESKGEIGTWPKEELGSLATNSSSRNGRWSLLQKSYGWRTRVV